VASVNLTDIEKRFGSFVALPKLNLSIADGEFLVLLGPSGCGKTTTMRIVAGLEEASAGELRIGDKVVNNMLPKDRDVAMVFQNYGLYPHMTVAGNIAYPLKVRGVPKAERERQVQAAAEKVELGPLLGRKPRELSGGQRQRVVPDGRTALQSRRETAGHHALGNQASAASAWRDNHLRHARPDRSHDIG